MPHRYKDTARLFPFLKLKPFFALREKWKEGYGLSDFRSDLMAGIIVALVAIPLGMALAIASGVAPQNGLYTVIVGGAVVALLGGSRCQVTGPTAAFVVILAPIVHQFGFSGLMLAGFIAGILLVMMGVLRFGRLIEFIPYPVTTGFTAGIGVVIATIQLKDFFGLHIEHMPDRYFEKVSILFGAWHSWQPFEFLIAGTTLFILVLWPKINRKIPSPLVALSVITLATIVLKKLFPDLNVATIGTRFEHGIPQNIPSVSLPWKFSAGQPLDFETIEKLLPSAFAIAMLGAIESLLSAVAADGMAQTKHDPDAELVALGIGNLLCPFFGGIAATGAIARTATNIRFGAKSPFAAVIHSVLCLLVIFFFAPYVSYLPMAALAALLVLVAYNMSEVKHFFHVVRVSPKSDTWVLLVCFGLTVLYDMVVGVTVGVVLASLLFMKRMASLTQGKLIADESSGSVTEKLPKGVLVYKIAGPLFFGAANRAIEAITQISRDVQCVVFDMSEVPAMDITEIGRAHV